MKKVLFLTPHLSTGGLPQYLFKKISLLKDKFEIYVIEYENITGGKFIVQRERIKNILSEDTFITLGSDKETDLRKHVTRIIPDIIHLEEIPEMWLPSNLAEQLYSKDRYYKIFETSHDSSFNIKNKRFLPDKFLLVSQYQVQIFSSLGIPCEVVEYPIEKRNMHSDARLRVYKNLGLNENDFHIINVGLFSSRKNQGEIIEYARQLDKPEYKDIKFHFIGNQAENFESYWGPLMKNLPSNVKIWGERSDVDNFFAIANLFLFTSRGNEHDKETMPLVIREAISWNVPSLIYNLPVYLDYFDSYKNIEYLDWDVSKNLDKILSKYDNDYIPFTEVEPKEVIIISSYPNNSALEDLTIKSILSAKKTGLPIILTSHCPISEKLQNLVDFVVYDKNNILIKHDYYSKSWYNQEKYYAEVNIKKEGNDLYHGPAVYTNYYNGINLANNLGFNKAYCFNFDMILTQDVFKTFGGIQGDKKGIFNINDALEGKTLRTVFHIIDPKEFISNFPLIQTGEEYNAWAKKVGSESNGLENIYYHQLKDKLNTFKLLTNDEYYKIFDKSEIDICSMVEYTTLLAVKNQPDKYAIWISTQNKEDMRVCNVSIGYNEKTETDYCDIRGITQKYWIRDKKGKEFITFIMNDYKGKILSEKVIEIDEKYNFEENGFIELK